MNRSRFVTGAAVLAAGAIPRYRAQAQGDQTLHVGISPFEAQADAYYAQELGLFRRAGLDVEIQQYQGGSLIVAAIVGGSLQIGGGSPLPTANARQRGLPIVLIAPGYMYDYAAASPIEGLAVTVNSPLRSAKDLEGKTVAITGLRSVDDIAVKAWVDQHGGNSSLVRVVEIPQSAMVDAVVAGRVDAAQIGDPALTAGIDAGRVRIFAKSYDAIAKRFFGAAWLSSETWANQNPETVRKFAAAINSAAAWAVKNPEAAATVLQKYMKVTFTKAHEYHARSLDPALVQPLLDAAVKYKMLAPMNAGEIIWKG